MWDSTLMGLGLAAWLTLFTREEWKVLLVFIGILAAAKLTLS